MATKRAGMTGKARWQRMTCACGLALLLAASVAAADDMLRAGGLDELGDAALSQAIIDYYQAEQGHDWQATYALRGPRFAAVVPYETYARQMDLDARGWQLVAIEGRTVRVDGGVTSVTLSFQEDLDHDIAARLLGVELGAPADDATPQRYSQPEVTQWAMEEGRWIALMPGARQHFVYNERLVWD